LKGSNNYHGTNRTLYSLVLIISLIAIIPLISIIYNSTTLNFSFLSSEHNWFFEYLINSLTILFFVIIFTSIFGIISAYLVTFYDFPGASFFSYSLILSFAVPPYIFGYSLSAFFENYGIGYTVLNNLFKVNDANHLLPNFSSITNCVFSLSFTLYGYVFILSKSAFSNQSRNLIDLGRNLGFSSFKRLTNIIIPSARPAIFVGISLVAMETLADFGTASHFGVSTFTTGIYNSWFIFDDLKTSNLLSLLLLIIVLIFFLLESLSRKNSKFHKLKNDGNNKKNKLFGFYALSAFLFCFILFFISFIFPFSQMIFWSYKFPEYAKNLNLIELNLNTFFLIFFTSLLIIFFSFLVNFGNRVLKSKFLNIITSLSISGYAIPGIIIAVSVISFFALLSDLLNINLKSIFIGTFFGLIVGYFLRFYSISYNSIKSNYFKINYSIDESAYLLGFNKYKTCSEVHWPIMKKNVYFIFILIAIEIIKELPITLILRPFNFDTFSSKAYQFASQDLIEAASVPSLFIIFWASLLILISHKYFFDVQNKL